MSRNLKLQNEGKNETGKVHFTKKKDEREKNEGKVLTIPNPDEIFWKRIGSKLNNSFSGLTTILPVWSGRYPRKHCHISGHP